MNASIERGRRQYVLGFGLSIITTLTSFYLVSRQILAGWDLVYAIVGLALLQVIIQLLCFLHVGHEKEPRWNLLALDFTLIVVVIVVIGTLWIMDHLNYHMTSPSDTDTYMIQDEGFQKR